MAGDGVEGGRAGGRPVVQAEAAVKGGGAERAAEARAAVREPPRRE